MKYSTILQKAKDIKNGVEKEYKLIASTPSYYIAKAILNHRKDVPDITVGMASENKGDYISNQIYQTHYMDMMNRFVKYVETNKKLPSYITWKDKKVKVSDYTYAFARILIYYDKYNSLPKYVNVNSKAYTKPTETGNSVFDYWVKKFGVKPTCIDDVCDYIRDHFNYEYYYDDHKTNKQVIDSKAGNCTDLSQMLSNMADALGYDWKCIHTQCRQSGTGHVYLKLKKKTSNAWFTRDVACIADESTYCIWCDVDQGRGTQLAVNPSWWLANRQR